MNVFRLRLNRCGGLHRPCSRRTFTRLRAAAASEQQQEEDTDVLIEFQNVTKSFGDKVILRGASFKIRRGEAVGIIGASGTGKSTTLRIAAGLLAPDSGNVLILGKARRGLLRCVGLACVLFSLHAPNNMTAAPTSDSADEEHLRVGMVFQNAALFDSLTVGENVGFLLYEHSRKSPADIERIVAKSLAKVGVRYSLFRSS